MATIKRNEIYSKLVNNGNLIFSIEYIKADGSLRKANCRLGVDNPKFAPKPNGNGMDGKTAYAIYNNIKYFDLGVEGNGGKGGYRTAKIDRIQKIKLGGVEYTVID